ncbi:type IV toxin-antitoxin system AbiEi family antitoxin domain-containing protein [Microtetraspora sp. AC03309]|uniref:type IV toxin-antitoxin system AbiEi family antitoxin domain-containing protein n=1 Tax=Microtetraspora sp. AC03309 TaxID=2779376 RepID=UPI001E655261|nr:type IV toxin-antitoxin system AbiEi family antitoxin domain-containing protein [Microtetraspora sp. AC03309]MCC5574283.1 type IV toxin-antitoxin system AbiEi family antitoxin domain-containing protein [Microtetraspora sp. AC03309]
MGEHTQPEIPDRLGPTFTTGEARRAGLSSRAMARLLQHDAIHELSRGVYRRADAAESVFLDLIAVAARVPRGIFCLETALSVHELTDEIPAVVNVAVPRNAGLPRVAYPPVIAHRFNIASFEEGLELREVAPGEHIRIYSPARSVVDCMRLRHRVGDEVALRALRSYLRRRGTTSRELMRFARLLDVEGPIGQAIEVVLA